MKDIYAFVTEEKTGFDKDVNIVDGWDWGFKKHVKRSILYKNSQFEFENENRDKRPFKNIVRPILNVQYRTEGFDVKDIEIYVNNPDNYHKSLIVRKFHEKWALKHGMDTFIDDVVESYVDFGGVLVKDVDDVLPEVVNLSTLAFCDQTDLLAGAFAIKHNLNPDELRKMKKAGWGEKSKGATIDLETLITLAEKQKESDKISNATPGKYIEVYEVHGIFEDSWLKREDYTPEEEKKYIPQMHVIGYYRDDKGRDVGCSLFAVKEPKLPFKFLARDKIKGRALGFGGVEELFEAQVWTNYSEVQLRELLEQASKVLYKTTDPRFKTRNNISEAKTGQIFDLQEGKDINQLDTTPRSIVIFENALQQWEQHAMKIGAASELMLNEAPASGTPFKSVEAQLIEGHSLHKWRQGKIAVFFDEIYRDWILPKLKREILKADKFMAMLSVDELQEVAERMMANEAAGFIKERILKGELVNTADVEMLKQGVKAELLKGGRKKFMEIVKDEFAEDELDVFTNIIGKQKNLALLTDKVVNVLRQFIAAPQMRQDPEMIKLLNVILESSGLSPIIFGASSMPMPQAMPQGGQAGGMEQLQAVGLQA